MKKLIIGTILVLSACTEQKQKTQIDKEIEQLQKYDKCLDCQIDLIYRGLDSARARINCEQIYLK